MPHPRCRYRSLARIAGGVTRSDFDRALQVEYRAAGDRNPVAEERTRQVAAATRKLARSKAGLAQAGSQIGDQGAVRGAGDRVLVDALGRRKETRDEINVTRSRRGDDYG